MGMHAVMNFRCTNAEFKETSADVSTIATDKLTVFVRIKCVANLPIIIIQSVPVPRSAIFFITYLNVSVLKFATF